MMALSRYLCRSNVFHGVRNICTTSCMNMKVGDKLPIAELYEGDPSKAVNMGDLMKGKVVIFGVTGAFSPTCSKEHAPGFVQCADSLKAKGVKDIVCISVNDPFVMQAWGNSLEAGNKVRFLADTKADFVKKADLTVDLCSKMGGIRSKRFVLVAEDGIVKRINVEPDGTSLTSTKVGDIINCV